MPNCLTCGSGIDEYDSAYYARNMLCIPCYTRKASEIPSISCSKCGIRVKQEEARSRRGNYYCSYCASELERVERLPVCPLCARKIESYQSSTKLSDGKIVHSDCASKAHDKKLQAKCSVCGRETPFFKVLPNGKTVCPRCDREGATTHSPRHAMPIIVRLVDRIGQMIG